MASVERDADFREVGGLNIRCFVTARFLWNLEAALRRWLISSGLTALIFPVLISPESLSDTKCVGCTRMFLQSLLTFEVSVTTCPMQRLNEGALICVRFVA